MRSLRLLSVCAIVFLGVISCVSGQGAEGEPEDDGLGTLRPFLVKTEAELLQNIEFAYTVLSNQLVEAGGDGILRPRDFHKFVELTVNPYSIAMTDAQVAALREHTDGWLTKYGFHKEDKAEQKLPMSLLSRGSPLRWLKATNEALKQLQRPAGAHEEL